jgi:hypothetical protein
MGNTNVYTEWCQQNRETTVCLSPYTSSSCKNAYKRIFYGVILKNRVSRSLAHIWGDVLRCTLCCVNKTVKREFIILYHEQFPKYIQSIFDRNKPRAYISRGWACTWREVLTSTLCGVNKSVKCEFVCQLISRAIASVTRSRGAPAQ